MQCNILVKNNTTFINDCLINRKFKKGLLTIVQCKSLYSNFTTEYKYVLDLDK